MNRIDIKRQARRQLSSSYWQVMYFVYIPSIIVAFAGITVVGTVLAAPFLIGSAYGLWQLYNEQRVNNNDIGIGYQAPHTLRNLIQLLLTGVFIFLWSLLLVIPGIIKAYSYAMVPYLLADPTISEEDAITLSRRMMDGHKWSLFVLQLSFIGWAILGLLTINILNIFYTVPYQQMATAGFYQELKRQYYA